MEKNRTGVLPTQNKPFQKLISRELRGNTPQKLLMHTLWGMGLPPTIFSD